MPLCLSAPCSPPSHVAGPAPVAVLPTRQVMGLALHLQVVYVGDGNNIVHSWIRLAAVFDFEFVCACPKGFEPDAATVELANASGAGRVSVSHEPFEVCASLSYSIIGLRRI